MDPPSTLRADEVPSMRLIARANPELLHARRLLFWRALDRLPHRRGDAAIWAELRRQIPKKTTLPGGRRVKFNYFEEPVHERSLPLVALSAPKMVLTDNARIALEKWHADYTIRGEVCDLEEDLIKAALFHLVGLLGRDDVIALSLASFDAISHDRVSPLPLVQLAMMRRELLRDSGMDKIRLKLGVEWAPLDSPESWDWGAVKQVFLLVHTGIGWSNWEHRYWWRDRVGKKAVLDTIGHWVLCVYVREANTVHVFDSSAYVVPEDAYAHHEAVVRRLLDPDINLFTPAKTKISVPSRVKEDPPGAVRIAYSQKADWECGSFVIHMAKLIAKGMDPASGEAIWNAWTSEEVKRQYALPGGNRLTIQLILVDVDDTELTNRQRIYTRKREARTMRELADLIKDRNKAWHVLPED